MPKRKSPPPESNSGSEKSGIESEVGSAPPKKNLKTAASSGRRRTRKVSQKQQEINEQQAHKDQNELEGLRKKVAKLRKQVKKAMMVGPNLARHDRTPGTHPKLRRHGAPRVVAKPDATVLTQPERQPSRNGHCGGNTVTTDSDDEERAQARHRLAVPDTSVDADNMNAHNTPTLRARTATHRGLSTSKDSADIAKAATPLKRAEFAHDEPPSGRPKASDYRDDVKFLLLDATHHFECHIIAELAYLNAEMAASWAQDLWTEACRSHGDGEEYEFMDRMATVIVSRKSNACGDMVEEIRKHVPAAYGFIATDTPSVRCKNIKLYHGLMEQSTFHYKTYDLEAGIRSGFLHNPLISKLIKECFFQMKSSHGVKYRKYFDPIHLPMLALLLTGIEHVIEEWSTGMQVPVAFREGDNERRYVNHVADIAKWAEPSPGVVRNICKKWHDRARRATGVGDDDKPTDHISATAIEDAQKELAGRTGDTDSEGDDE
ncbi:hypothetical protein BKA93DRAFT_829178 [Sparassis latifolia]